jgi:phage shock protein PspC (stress-responsive transcriptional regulator)
MSTEIQEMDVKTAPTGETKLDVQNIEQEETVKTTHGATTGSDGFRFSLYRHPSDKLIGGVCGGLGDYLRIDPTLVRILWVVATITTGGGGFLAYLALWLLLPVGTVRRGQVRPAALELTELNLSRAAKVLIVLGGLLLLSNLGILPSLWNGFWTVMRLFFWPALLISIGYLLLRGTGQTAGWRVNLGDWRSRMPTASRVNVPGKAEFKSGLQSLRQSFPLKRSRRDRFFLGVCGGLGKKLGVDSNLVRLVWAAVSVGTGGMAAVAYLVIGLLLPEETPLPTNGPSINLQDVQVIDGTATYKV